MTTVAHTLLCDGEGKVDMRFVYPKEMLLKQAWKKWAAEQEYEELKEGIWLEPWPCSEGEPRKYGRRSTAMYEGSWSWKEVGCGEDCSILVGRTKANAKDDTKKKARRSKCFTTAHVGMRSDVRSQRNQ